MSAADRKPYSKTRDIRIGLEIFERHGGTNCSAEHDEFFSGPADNATLTEAERAQLEAAGWFYREEYDSWMIFT